MNWDMVLLMMWIGVLGWAVSPCGWFGRKQWSHDKIVATIIHCNQGRITQGVGSRTMPLRWEILTRFPLRKGGRFMAVQLLLAHLRARFVSGWRLWSCYHIQATWSQPLLMITVGRGYNFSWTTYTCSVKCSPICLMISTLTKIGYTWPNQGASNTLEIIKWNPKDPPRVRD